MIRVLSLLALIGAVYGSWDEPSFNVRFGLFGNISKDFVEMPLYQENATKLGWEETTRPTSPEGLESLVMYCPTDDYTLCLLYDDTNYIAGAQFSLNKKYIKAYIYDWEIQGFINWNVTFTNGTEDSYWTKQIYFYSAETLATSSSSRLASRNSTTILQDNGIWVTGFYGQLYKISSNISDIAAADSDFKEQSCFIGMGHHYYYNMTTSLQCASDTMFNWFPLVYDNRLAGAGLSIFAKYAAGSWYEHPPKAVVKFIANHGPDCLYDLVDSPGFMTLHMYFVKPALKMLCIFE